MKTTNNFFFSLALSVLLSLFIFIIYGDNGLAEMNSMKETRSGLTQKNEKLIQKNLSLYHRIDRLKNDPVYIENVARLELGVIAENERIYKVSDVHRNFGVEE